ncbi:MAG: hypothetical protein WBC70_00275 [Candidatus Aminicenantales bacterium]
MLQEFPSGRLHEAISLSGQFQIRNHQDIRSPGHYTNYTNLLAIVGGGLLLAHGFVDSNKGPGQERICSRRIFFRRNLENRPQNVFILGRRQACPGSGIVLTPASAEKNEILIHDSVHDENIWIKASQRAVRAAMARHVYGIDWKKFESKFEEEMGRSGQNNHVDLY